MVLALLLCIVGFLALGIWQLERRVEKHALIAAVESRTRAKPVYAPGAAEWPRISASRDAYRHIRATGHYLPNRRTLVRAVTDLGGGYWVLVPLDTGHFTLLVNRGFIPHEGRYSPTREPQGRVSVTGLLRITEPNGGFLRSNDAASDLWYSRDVAAIAKARRLHDAAPYFLDAEATVDGPGEPVGGLTVVRFADNHLSYALTWFAMAGLCAWGVWRLLHMPE